MAQDADLVRTATDQVYGKSLAEHAAACLADPACKQFMWVGGSTAQQGATYNDGLIGETRPFLGRCVYTLAPPSPSPPSPFPPSPTPASPGGHGTSCT